MERENKLVIILKAQNSLIHQLNEKIKELTIANHYLINFLKFSGKSITDEKIFLGEEDIIAEEIENLTKLIKETKPLLHKDISFDEFKTDNQLLEVCKGLQNMKVCYGSNLGVAKINMTEKKMTDLHNKDQLNSKTSSIVDEEYSTNYNSENTSEHCESSSNSPLRPSPDQMGVNHVVWCKLSALIKGYLTRRIMLSNKVQYLLRTVRDCAAFALSVRGENIKSSDVNNFEIGLSKRTLQQMKLAICEIHQIFFEWPSWRKMKLVEQVRLSEREESIRKYSEQGADSSEAASINNMSVFLPALNEIHKKFQSNIKLSKDPYKNSSSRLPAVSPSPFKSLSLCKMPSAPDRTDTKTNF